MKAFVKALCIVGAGFFVGTASAGTDGEIQDALNEARAVPNFDDGKPVGYQVVPAGEGSVYERLGIKNGDVIMGVNGQTVDDPGQALEQLSHPKEIQVQEAN